MEVVFFWPKDFTFVCPTEIAAFGKLESRVPGSRRQVLGVSTDSEFVHLAWRKEPQDLKNLPFPMLADIKRELSTSSACWIPKRACRSARRSSSIRQGVDPFRERDRPDRRPQRRGSHSRS